jgi:hypothetical protein
MVSNSESERPWGCSVSGSRRIRSTTFTTRTFSSGRCWRRSATAASVSRVGMSPQQAMTTSGTEALVVGGERPDAQSSGAVVDCLVHAQPVELGLLAGDDDVDVVLRAQAVVGHREQAVGVRWEVDADDLGLLVDHVVDEAGVLVEKPLLS